MSAGRAEALKFGFLIALGADATKPKKALIPKKLRTVAPAGKKDKPTGPANYLW